MESYSNFSSSFADSGDSSPRSRETDCENPSSWDDAPSSCKVKFMFSYGGKIAPRPHDHQLAYVGGDTKILAVDRNVKFAAIVSKLSSLCDAPLQVPSFKYQLPGEDLDALVSVTNDEDLDHMMLEYDRQRKLAPLKSSRLRLFLFPLKSPSAPRATALQEPVAESAAPEASFPAAKVPAQVDPDRDRNLGGGEALDNIVSPEDVQTQISELQRLQISNQRIKNEAFSGDLYVQKIPDNAAPSAAAVLVPTTLQIPTSNYWHGAAAAAKATEEPPPVYVIARDQVNHGYHPMQSIVQDVYGNVGLLPQPQMVGRYAEGGGGGGLFRLPAGEAYPTVAYAGAGRQVYYRAA